jgi:membrane-associated progesterone receptor component
MSGKFEPKAPVTLDPPKDGPVSVEELAKANGMRSSAPLISAHSQRYHTRLSSSYSVLNRQPGALYRDLHEEKPPYLKIRFQLVIAFASR